MKSEDHEHLADDIDFPVVPDATFMMQARACHTLLGRSTSSANCSSSGSTQLRNFSSSTQRQRNLPARRPVDPLDSAPNAERHRLQTGETFIVRPAPSAATLRNAVVEPAQATSAPDASTSSLTQSLFPGFSSAARAAPASATATGGSRLQAILPPPLKPRARGVTAGSQQAPRTLNPAQIEELRELRLSTAQDAQPGSEHSVRALAARFGVSPAFVRIAAPLPRHLRNAKLLEAEERTGREFWGFKKRLARFERRVRRELW